MILALLLTLGALGPRGQAHAGERCLDLIARARGQEANGHPRDALVTYFEALACNPNVIEGQFTGRLEPFVPLAPAARAWRKGASLTGKTVLVYSVKGHGDSLQFVRFVKSLAAAGPARVLLAVPDPLRRLFVDSFADLPRIEVIARDDAGRVARTADLHASLLSLPYLMNIRTVTGAPYLRTTKTIDVNLDPAFVNVGVVFSGDPHHPHNADRSFGPDDLRTLAGVPNLRLYSLQPGSEDLIRRAGRALEVRTSILPKLGDFADTASVINQLDAVISADTSVSHLAAALGKPTFVPLSFRTDLRYAGRARATNWYDGMVLLRQTKQGDWDEPMRGLRDEVVRLRRSRR